VVSHGLAQGYGTVGLAGFSMGGNLTLLYLAEQSEQIDSRICGGIAFSVPCDLAGSADTLARPSRKIYMQRFLRDLQVKMEEKSRKFPDLIDTTGFDTIQTFHEFDDRFTAPLHGFANAQDYWRNCSALWRLKDIRVPALMVNARDDPFLSDRCFPIEPAVLGSHTRVEFPKWGGHVGFVESAADGLYWSERRAVRYFASFL
jgi:predicted alpha/beta-fold hydrolase